MSGIIIVSLADFSTLQGKLPAENMTSKLCPQLREDRSREFSFPLTFFLIIDDMVS